MKRHKLLLLVFCQSPPDLPWSVPSWVIRLLAQLGTLGDGPSVTFELTLLGSEELNGVTPDEREQWRRSLAEADPSLTGIAADAAAVPRALWTARQLDRVVPESPVFSSGPAAGAMAPGLGRLCRRALGSWEGPVEDLPRHLSEWLGDEQPVAGPTPETVTPAWMLAKLPLARYPLLRLPLAWDPGGSLRTPEAVADECEPLTRMGVGEVILEGPGTPPGEMEALGPGIPESWWERLADRMTPLKLRWSVMGSVEDFPTRSSSTLSRGGCRRLWLRVRGFSESGGGPLIERVRDLDNQLPVARIAWEYSVSPSAVRTMRTLGGLGYEVVPTCSPVRRDLPAAIEAIMEDRAGWIFPVFTPSPRRREEDHLRESAGELGLPGGTFGQRLLALMDAAPGRPLLRFHDGEGTVATWSVREFWEETERCAAALLELGVRKGDFILFARCYSPETTALTIAALVLGAIPIGSGRAQLRSEEEIFRLADPVLSVRDGEGGRTLHLQRGTRSGATEAITWDEIRKLGNHRRSADPGAVRRRAADVTPRDPAVLFFSSGTTGPSKPVLLPHGYFFPPSPPAANGWNIFSYLPLGGHGTSLTILAFCIARGSCYSVADPAFSPEAACRLLRPSLVHLPLSQYQALHRELSGSEQSGEDPAHVGELLRARYGGNVRAFFATGVAIPRAMEEAFLRWGIPLTQSYGLTEVGVMATSGHGIKPGTVGRLTPATRLRFASDGEIFVKRPFMMLEYFRDPEATAGAFDRDGWFATGDVGSFDDEGFLTVMGRKKEVIIPSTQGRIFPRIIEDLLTADHAIAEAVVCGEGKSHLVGLVVPTDEFLKREALALGLQSQPRVLLVEHPALRSRYLERIRRLLAHLPPEYQLENVALLANGWGLETENLTDGSRKVPRAAILMTHREIIESLYANEG